MSAVATIPDAPALDLARECLYRFLAAILSDPESKAFRLARNRRNRLLAQGAADLLREEVGAASVPLGFGELAADQLDLRPLLKELRRPQKELIAEYDRVFGLVPARECPPHETEYHTNADTFFRAQQMADVAGFYRAFGLETAHETPERPDHVALELEFMAFLLTKRRLALAAGGGGDDQARVCDEAMRAFFVDHVIWWLPSFATGLRRRAERGPYVAASRILAAFLPLERKRFGVTPPRLPLNPVPEEPREESTSCAGCDVAP
jgi:TorA maturation chaperone TorD